MHFISEQSRNDTLEAWGVYMDALEKSIKDLEKDIEATEHVIDEINNSLFTISEPRWSSDEDFRRIKALKRRVREFYTRYKSHVPNPVKA